MSDHLNADSLAKSLLHLFKHRPEVIFGMGSVVFGALYRAMRKEVERRNREGPSDLMSVAKGEKARARLGVKVTRRPNNLSAGIGARIRESVRDADKRARKPSVYTPVEQE